MRLGLPLIPLSIVIRLERRPRAAFRPRPTIRSLMIAVGAVGAALGGYVGLIHSPTELWAREYRRQAAHHARWEAHHRALAALATRGADPAGASRESTAAERRRAWRRRYEVGLWTPWRTVMPGPSEPTYDREPAPPSATP